MPFVKSRWRSDNYLFLAEGYRIWMVIIHSKINSAKKSFKQNGIREHLQTHVLSNTHVLFQPPNPGYDNIQHPTSLLRPVLRRRVVVKRWLEEWLKKDLQTVGWTKYCNFRWVGKMFRILYSNFLRGTLTDSLGWFVVEPFTRKPWNHWLNRARHLRAWRRKAKAKREPVFFFPFFTSWAFFFPMKSRFKFSENRTPTEKNGARPWLFTEGLGCGEKEWLAIEDRPVVSGKKKRLAEVFSTKVTWHLVK